MGLRDDHGSDGEIVCAGSIEALGDLLWCGNAAMLDVTVFEIAVEGVEVEEFGDIRMRCRAVVAFVEIIGQNLPVVVSF